MSPMTNQTESLPIDAAIMLQAEATNPAGTHRDDPCGEITAADCSALAREAERELAAFLATIRTTFGPEATGRAADQWVEVFETTQGILYGSSAPFRGVTIHAANRLAHGPSPNLSSKTQDLQQ